MDFDAKGTSVNYFPFIGSYFGEIRFVSRIRSDIHYASW